MFRPWAELHCAFCKIKSRDMIIFLKLQHCLGFCRGTCCSTAASFPHSSSWWCCLSQPAPSWTFPWLPSLASQWSAHQDTCPGTAAGREGGDGSPQEGKQTKQKEALREIRNSLCQSHDCIVWPLKQPSLWDRCVWKCTIDYCCVWTLSIPHSLGTGWGPRRPPGASWSVRDQGDSQ